MEIQQDAVPDFNSQNHKIELSNDDIGNGRRAHTISTHRNRSTEVDLAYLTNAATLMRHGEFHLALNLIRVFLNKSPRNANALKILTRCLENLERWTELITVRKAIVKFDFSFDAIFSLASTQYQLGLDREALQSYFECLAILQVPDSRLFDIYKNLGNIFVRQRDFDAAEEYYNKAYTLKIQEDVLLVNFGTLSVQKCDYDKALDCFRRAVDINSYNDKAWFGLALVHSHFGDFELAWANIERAIDVQPNNLSALQIYGQWALQRDRPDKPLEALRRVIFDEEIPEELLIIYVHLLCKKGLIKSAKFENQRALLCYPTNETFSTLQREFKKHD